MYNTVYSHPEQPQLQVEVILASTAAVSGTRIYTIRMRYPRPIHGEIMTHRDFSRNARSSRAVPVRTMLEEVKNTPYIPWHWYKNKPGMQGTEPLTPDEEEKAKAIWIQASKYAVQSVEGLFDPNGLNIHKQNPNRLLEPFSWIDTLITATKWNNFLWLRQHNAAEPHLQDLANLVSLAISNTQPQELGINGWHLPYVSDEELGNDIAEWLYDGNGELFGLGQGDIIKAAKMISAARCARISYVPFDGDGSYLREIERANRLLKDERVHASPFEHQAKPDVNFAADRTLSPLVTGKWMHPELHGNLTGWIQHRKQIPNEVYLG